ncbi:MAG TPA: hypothetical protein VL588_03640, partial [Bdellovibrionota bacterium]|nr:hypothetical protein [Bdellovibrionota bacterium]
MRRRILTPLCALALALGFVPGAARASLENPKLIGHSVGVYFSHSGQKYFADNLESILFMNGYSFSTGMFETWPLEADHQLDLDHLFTDPEKQKTVNFIRSTLRNYLSGFHYDNPQFHVDINGIEYALVFDRFGLVPDNQQQQALGEPNSLVMVLEGTVPEMRVEASSIIAHDLNPKNNKIVAWNHETNTKADYCAGLRDVSLEFGGPGATPLRVQVPLLLSVKQGGGLNLKVLGITSNLEDLNMTARFRRPIDLPRVTVSIGDMHTSANPALENQLISRQPQIIKALQT